MNPFMPTADQTPEQVAHLAQMQTIEKLEQALQELPQSKIPEYKKLANGMFMKVIVIPQGTIGIGAEHTQPFFEVIMQGRMIMLSPFEEPQLAQAPYIGMGMPGRRKVGYALTDTIWATFHRSDAESIEEAEAEQIVVPDYIKNRSKP